MLELIVEEVLSEFISNGHIEISRLTLGVGRSRLAAALAQLYRGARGQGLSLEDLALATGRVHATEEDHARALEELERTMDDVSRTADHNAGERGRSFWVLAAKWPEVREFLTAIPAHETLGEYCRCIEDFRRHRPQATSTVADHVKALDTLVLGY